MDFPPAHRDATTEISGRCGLGGGCRSSENEQADGNRDLECIKQESASDACRVNQALDSLSFFPSRSISLRRPARLSEARLASAFWLTEIANGSERQDGNSFARMHGDVDDELSDAVDCRAGL
jgi:hypothetical protein